MLAKTLELFANDERDWQKLKKEIDQLRIANEAIFNRADYIHLAENKWATNELKDFIQKLISTYDDEAKK